MNRLFKTLNKNSFPARQVPTLEMVGITEEAFSKDSHKPIANTHIYEEWYHGDKKWPRDKSFAKEIVHLRNSARLGVWKAVHHYFTCVF